MTAFLVESYKTLQQDPTRTMVTLLQQIALQTSSFSLTNGFINSTISQPSRTSDPVFQPTSNAKCVNILWFASLVISLATASLGIVVKQWLREYLAGEHTSAQARLRIRHFRHPALARWKVFEIAAVLPLLLQLSLALFLAGLCFFTAEVHQSIGHTTLPLVSAWAFLLVAVTFLPVANPTCPYQTSFLKDGLNYARRLNYRYISLLVSYIPERLFPRSAKALTDYILRWLMFYEEELAREVRSDKHDAHILLAVDAIQSDDQLLNHAMWEALQQADLDHDDLAKFLFAALGHRVQCDASKLLPRSFLNLRPLPKTSYAVIMDMVADLLLREPQSPPTSITTTSHTRSRTQTDRPCDEWVEYSICVLLSESRFPHSERVNRVLRWYLADDGYRFIAQFIHSRINIYTDTSNKFLGVLQRLSGGLLLIEDPMELLVVMQQLFQPPPSLPSSDPGQSAIPISVDDGRSICEDDGYFQVLPGCQDFVVELFVFRIQDACTAVHLGKRLSIWFYKL
ncbi:hypothetical protein BDY19DRAFT_462342 [Irpex rosettiformis]|uniref:Uncharacterized protein n=1 Tax=Irpex rosettiformis TaxID=378272 RepID=A0ACB8TSN1_9APHY|nr:hypothetical protein BDY19DRAFT_462342 [Irpex rosettiformis]